MRQKGKSEMKVTELRSALRKAKRVEVWVLLWGALDSADDGEYISIPKRAVMDCIKGAPRDAQVTAWWYDDSTIRIN